MNPSSVPMMDEDWTIQVHPLNPQATVPQTQGSSALKGTMSFSKELEDIMCNFEKDPHPGMDISMDDFIPAVIPQSASQLKSFGSEPTAIATLANQPSMKGSGFTPLRQESLDTIQFKNLHNPLAFNERSTLFNDVLEQLASKEDAAAPTSGLYTLPSMQFLESLLDEMDTRTTISGQAPAEPPLYLPIQDFDIAETVPKRHSGENRRHSMPGTSPGIFASLEGQRQFGKPSAYYPPVAASAANSPVKNVPQRVAPARPPQSYADFAEFEEAEMSMSMQTSKSGRMRKVAHFAGLKRKVALNGDMVPQQAMSNAASYMSVQPNGMISGAPSVAPSMNTMNSDDCCGSEFSYEEGIGDEVSKGGTIKPRKAGGSRRRGKRTVCLNCGGHQTPQWRCGPLGPRTLCNACGVRFKKGLPLTCWPLRDGMVLPAPLPSNIQVPPGMTIIVKEAPIIEAE